MNSRLARSLAAGLCLGGLTGAVPAAAQLPTAGTLLLQQGVNGIQDFRSSDDAFGTVLAWGDFDGDGFDDLAIGVPDEDVLFEDDGLVQVVYGGPAGLTATGNQRFPRFAVPGAGTPHAGDRMGHALAVGDFDLDGFDDLAIGIPGDEVSGQPLAGSVLVLHGSADRLSTAFVQLWNQDVGSVNGAAEAGDSFGSALAVGNFSGGGNDLAIGVPFEAIGNTLAAGAVAVLRGTEDGLVDTLDLLIDRGSFGGPPPALDDHFGFALATGNLDGNEDDLVIGAPGVDNGPFGAAGEVFFLRGEPGGLDPTDPALQSAVQRDDVLCRPDATLDAAGAGDGFGSALAVADFDADGNDDVAVGIPGATVDGQVAAGQVDVLYFPALFVGEDSDCWNQDVPGVGGVFPDDGERFGASLAAGDLDGDLFPDLVVGVPGEKLGPVTGIGGLHLFQGAASGLAPAAEPFWTQNSPGVPDGVEPGDAFATAVAFGDADGDSRADLAVGVPGEEIDNDRPNHGAVVVFRARSVLFADGFESGDTGAWSATLP